MLRRLNLPYDVFAVGADTRLARYVLALARNDREGAPEVELPLAKEDLATLMAITPEHLSRILLDHADRSARAGAGQVGLRVRLVGASEMAATRTGELHVKIHAVDLRVAAAARAQRQGDRRAAAVVAELQHGLVRGSRGGQAHRERGLLARQPALDHVQGELPRGAFTDLIAA